MSLEFYVLDKESGEIINCITAATEAGAEKALAGFTRSDQLELSEHPPLRALQAYRFWDERP